MNKFEEIRTFILVTELGGFSACSRHLKLPRATVSARVAQLEKRIGARLLKRSTRSVQLTSEGLEYFNTCKASLDNIAFVEQRLSQKNELRGNVLISVPAMLPDFSLLNSIREFQEKHPGVAIEIVATDRVLNFIEHGVDLAIRGKHPNTDAIVAKKVGSVPMIIVSKKVGLFQKFEPETMPLSDPLSMAPFVCIKPAISSNDLNISLSLAVSGASSAILPEPICTHYIDNNLLNIIDCDTSLPELEIFLLYEPKRLLSPQVAAFADFLKEVHIGESKI